MKKITILWLVVLLTMSAEAQTTTGLSRDANISLFSGYLLKQQNINCNAYYYGVYADHPIIKGEKWNFGAWGVYDRSSFQDNISRYKSSSSEMMGGLNTGIYLDPKLGSLYSFYGGLGVGYKYGREVGTVNKRNYASEGIQTDQMIVSNVNLNLFRNARWLPRTQLIYVQQIPLSSEKTLSENNQPVIIVPAWKRGFYEITLKQSLVDIPLNLSGELLLEPKLGIAYDHYAAGFPEAYSLIGEIALKRLFSDDFLSFTFQYKSYPGKETNYFVYGLSINVLRIIEKRK